MSCKMRLSKKYAPVGTEAIGEQYNTNNSNILVNSMISVNGHYQKPERSKVGWRINNEPLEIAAKGDWSPCVFLDGMRGTANFLNSAFLYGDIDDGINISEFMEIFGGYKFIILTSRNHQKEKHGIIADRFHVLFPREIPYINAKDLQNDLKAMVTEYSFFDPAVTDAARFFFGYTEVQVISRNGKEFTPAPKIPQKPMVNNARTTKSLEWIIDGVRQCGRAIGRQDFCYRVAQWAYREGIPPVVVESGLLETGEGLSLSYDEPFQFQHALRGGR